jgi:hypothetical protein
VSQVVTLELSDEVYTALMEQATNAGVSISEWLAVALEKQSGLLKKQQTDTSEEARQRFRRHAGAIDLGYPTGANNDSIDNDLVRAYNGGLT